MPACPVEHQDDLLVRTSSCLPRKGDELGARNNGDKISNTRHASQLPRELSSHHHVGEMTRVKLLKMAVLCAPATAAPSTYNEILLVDPYVVSRNALIDTSFTKNV